VISSVPVIGCISRRFIDQLTLLPVVFVFGLAVVVAPPWRNRAWGSLACFLVTHCSDERTAGMPASPSASASLSVAANGLREHHGCGHRDESGESDDFWEGHKSLSGKRLKACGDGLAGPGGAFALVSANATSASAPAVKNATW
jgi:hypothetical protein